MDSRDRVWVLLQDSGAAHALPSMPPRRQRAAQPRDGRNDAARAHLPCWVHVRVCASHVRRPNLSSCPCWVLL